MSSPFLYILQEVHTTSVQIVFQKREGAVGRLAEKARQEDRRVGQILYGNLPLWRQLRISLGLFS